ncbi:carboxypeptidase-like regulatory domain-containing protein [Pontibacter sp. BT310]|uniref:Carboxypeptidase-like regulatory domain-containing protein n=1 Tax=Pontibacter populi TaxID=890055 RepID=A0ABS6XCB1_9BACT|nr:MULTISPECIES: carboxypeptidase-like regulatory domain-containing protein [Pontibacter]MBJ6118698.1 carboxypeptidase-like regulatory domain-containing protein [Pontibacter sp. BT310]MBR0571127.1 carboxypeptidase-like regulatory domain-containing protein [Microvirga sp. STS03]MBW3365552.1 carboxypeptidase-like regulatory domain-containing protein [Pontibacter populi]
MLNYSTLENPRLYFLLAAIVIVSQLPAKAQQLKPVVQLSGVVVTADSSAGLAGIAVYVPGTNRGTVSKQDGFFTLPVLAGDSVVFQALGFEKQYLIVPKTNTSEKYTTSIRLKQIARQLPEVQVMPWATQQDFKMAVKNLDLPDEAIVKPELGPLPGKHKSIFGGPQMDALDNIKQGFKHHQQMREQRYLVPSTIRIF